VAIVYNIAEMYLRVQLIPKDRPYHRFLWRNLDSSKPPCEYELNSLVLGINAAPFLPQFVSR